MIEKVIHNVITPYSFWVHLNTIEDVDSFLYQRDQEGYRVEQILYKNLNAILPVWVGYVSKDLLGIPMEIITKDRLKSEFKILTERIG